MLAKAQANGKLALIQPQHFDIEGVNVTTYSLSHQKIIHQSVPQSAYVTDNVSLKSATDEFQTQFIQQALVDNKGQ